VQSYGSFLVPGVLLVVIQQVVLISLAFSVGWQREDGDLKNAVRFPFTHLEGKAVAHLGFWIAGIAFIVFFIFPFFGWPVRSPLGLFLVYSALALAMIPPAICVSSFTTDRFVSFQLLLFFSAPVFMMSGYSWPLWRMPHGIELLAWVFPATPALQAVRILTLKSSDLSLIAGPMKQLGLQMLAWTAVAVLCAHLGQRIRSRRAARAVQQQLPAPEPALSAKAS
jgi:ABC-2 type transport system permease protein